MSGETRRTTATQAKGPLYTLRLYVTGATPASSRAIAHLKAFCETFLKGRYQLEVVDVYQQPGLADEERVFATPTVVKTSPLPSRRIVGNISDPARLVAGLGLV